MLEGSILHQLKEAHQPGQPGKRPLNFGVYYKNTLVALCHALEDCILTSRTKPLVITAFQRGKWYLQEADRYADIADSSHQVVIMAAPDSGFAEHPTSQRANVELVNLDPSDPVAQEWHLMILAPSYTAMVLCQELSSDDYGKQGPPTQDLERKFYGFWTFEANLIQETVELTIDHIQRYNPELATRLSAQVQEIAAAQTGEREDPGPIVSRVVDYLQSWQTNLNLVAQTDSFALHQDILDSNLVSNEVQAFLRMAQLTDQADGTNPNAASEVAALVEAIGQLLDLPAWQLNRLRLAGLLHRLAPLQKTETDLSPGSSRYGDAATDVAPSCPLVPGAQVLRTMPQMRAIATIITHQTEHWNGTGQPAKLAGDEIPLESRILGLAAHFQQELATLRSAATETGKSSAPPETWMTKALEVCQQEQGDRWDPKLVDTLALLVYGLQQGLNLSVNTPKISAGLWLVDSHCGDDLFR
ncbi:metal-dependent phosphohydrolase [Kovacikia minuta CCNUW1]|uniref:DICT sensory domain-containing protein n=1 Tax=Kovacikia minuta TaxID=2931930 RepID=UPI001CCCBFA5|nr:DICT sensory domain-containing protein [Kovacikia minuta]UBF23599.1 metal-dependent phosphohydrolase [Kovacikia minuta CCNUW1]